MIDQDYKHKKQANNKPYTLPIIFNKSEGVKYQSEENSLYFRMQEITNR